MKFFFFICFIGFQSLLISQNASYHLEDFLLEGKAQLLDNDAFILTDNLHYQSGSIWYPEQLDLDQPFSIVMDLFFGCSDGGADGMVFVLTTNPDLGAQANGIGFRGITPSIGLEMDTYQDAHYGDPHYDHIAMMRNGATRHRSGKSEGRPLLFQRGNVEDCRYHSLQVDWNPRKLKLRAAFDGEWILNEKINLSKSIFSGASSVYWGVTGATGDNRNQQLVKLKRMHFTEIMKKEDRANFLPDPIELSEDEEHIIASKTIDLDRMVDYLSRNEKYFIVLEHRSGSSTDKLEKIQLYLKENGVSEGNIILQEVPTTESSSEERWITVRLVEIKV